MFYFDDQKEKTGFRPSEDFKSIESDVIDDDRGEAAGERESSRRPACVGARGSSGGERAEERESSMKKVGGDGARGKGEATDEIHSQVLQTIRFTGVRVCVCACMCLCLCVCVLAWAGS